MKKVSYRGHTIELSSERMRSQRWVPKAIILIEENKTVKRIPVYGRRRASFDTQREADSCALELAKLWVDGRVSGGNGRY